MPEYTVQDIANTTPEALARLMAGPPEALAPWVSVAARAGLVHAQAILGQMLLDGVGMAQDPYAGLQWLTQAARAGHAVAMNTVGRCYENGWGTDPDAQAAREWFRQAAEAGLDQGLFNYANHLASGRGGVEPDMAQAYTLYRRAAELGYARAIGVVGRFYETGEVVARDLAQAMDWYARAAQGGDAHGMFHYARLLLAQGQKDEAFQWFQKMAATATPEFMEEARKLLVENGMAGLTQPTGPREE